MTDHYTYDIVEGFLPPEQVIRAGVSRLVVDVERFTEERRSLLDKWYFTHHRRLTDAVDRALERFEKALITDIHSYPLVPLGYELSKEAHRPQICIGTDEYHTPPQRHKQPSISSGSMALKPT